MKRIKKFGVIQTAKVVALIYFFVSLVFILPFFLLMSAVSGFNDAGGPFALFGGAFALVVPFFYAAVVFVTTAIGCLIYNLVSGWTGGIEVEIEGLDTASDLERFGKADNTY